MPACLDKYWMQPNGTTTAAQQKEVAGWPQVITGDLTGISANTTYRVWYSYEGSDASSDSYLRVAIGTNGTNPVMIGEDNDSDEVATDGNKHFGYYKYVDVTSGNSNLGNLYIKSGEKRVWPGTLLMVAVTTTSYSSGSGIIDAVNMNCKNENPYFFTTDYSYNPDSQYLRLHGNNGSIIDGWSLWGNWKYVPAPHNHMLDWFAMGGENSSGNMKALDWDLETADFPGGEYTGNTGGTSYNSYMKSNGMSMFVASMFGAHSPSGMRMNNWVNGHSMSSAQFYHYVRGTTYKRPIRKREWLPGDTENGNTGNNVWAGINLNYWQDEGSIRGFWGGDADDFMVPYTGIYRNDSDKDIGSTYGLSSKGLKLPSNSQYGTGDNFTIDFWDEMGSGRNSIIQEARPGQTFTVRVWVRNPNPVDIPFTLWAFFVDEAAVYDTGTHTHSAASQTAANNTGATYYSCTTTIPATTTNFREVSFNFKAPYDKQWIQGVTTRIDNDLVSNTQRPLYIDNWSLWRRNISLFDLWRNGEGDGEYQDWDMNNNGTRPETAGANVLSGSTVLNQSEAHIRLSEAASQPTAFDEMIFWLSPASKICRPVDRDFILGSSPYYSNDPLRARDLVGQKWCKGSSGTGGGEDTANFPPINGNGSWGGPFYFQNGKGINVEGDLGTPTAFTIAGWYKLHDSAFDTQYICDARNGGGDWYLFNYTNWNINVEDRLRYRFTTDGYSAAALPYNKWMHIIIASDQNSSYLYINGVDLTPYCYSHSQLDRDLGNNFRIGTRYTTSGQLDGMVGDFRIFKKAFSPAEARWLFHHTKGPYDSPDFLLDMSTVANCDSTYAYTPPDWD